MQGLMIESHIDQALPGQMPNNRLTPDALVEIIKHLTLRKPEIRNSEVKNKLEELRNQIDKIDDCDPEDG